MLDTHIVRKYNMRPFFLTVANFLQLVSRCIFLLSKLTSTIHHMRLDPS